MKKAQENEVNLLLRWKNVVDGMLPKPYKKNDGFCLKITKRTKTFEDPNYSRYQLEYISLVLWSVLNVRRKILKADASPALNLDIIDRNKEHIEDVLYLTVILIDQAKDIFTSKFINLKTKQSKFKTQYTCYLSKFIEATKEDLSIKSTTLEDDVVMVNIVINLLHKAADFNEKYLGRVLRPYLKDLFEVSFAISWHIEDMKKRLVSDELNSLGCFCKLVNSGEITPAQGILDAVKKNWTWAKDMMELAERIDIRIVLTPDREHVNQYAVYPNERSTESKKKPRDDRNIVRRKDTFLGRNFINGGKGSKGITNKDNLSQHEFLKIKSPLTTIISKIHRKGEHRGCGDIFMSLIYMKKMGVFQEITTTLSDEEKTNLSEILNELQESQKCSSQGKSWTNTLPKVQKNISFTSKEEVQKYIPIEESLVMSDIEENQNDHFRLDSLIRNCKTLRLTENKDYAPLCTNPRVIGMLKKSESLTY